MEPVVLSLGGSVLVDEEPDITYVRKLAKILIGISFIRKLYVVTGGGRIARYYIRAGRELGADEGYLDEMGIEVTRLNARLLIAALGDHSNHAPSRSYDDAVHSGRLHSIVVMGGVSPGITTDAVSALLAERVRAGMLVNATSVEGAYTADPEKDATAKFIPRMTHAELVKLIGTQTGAGPHHVFDPVGATVLQRSKIPLAIVYGKNLPNLRDALGGKKFKGTLVQ